MKEEQRNLTLGQVADMKKNLEQNIKNQLTEFMKQTGINALQLDGWSDSNKEITDNDSVESKYNVSCRINIVNFLNN